MGKTKSASPSFEDHLRRHLAQVAKLCASEGLRPGDVVLLMARFAPEEASMFPRAAAFETMGRHRLWPAIEELLARPGKPNEVLHLVADGEAVTGALIPLPEIVPPVEEDALMRALDPELTALTTMVGQLLARGRELRNFVAILDEGRQPAVVPRSMAETSLQAFGWGALVHELSSPCERDDLLVYFKVDGKPEMGVLKMLARPPGL